MVTLSPEVSAVQEVGAEVPACLHLITVDGAVDKAWGEDQGLMSVAVNRPATRKADSGQLMHVAASSLCLMQAARRSAAFVHCVCMPVGGLPEIHTCKAHASISVSMHALSCEPRHDCNCSPCTCG